MQPIKFGEVVKHGKREFAPGVVYGVSDAAAEYFIAAGWAAATDEDVVVTVADAELEIDANTVWGSGPDKGKRVLG